ncbi:hypothetical protein [Glaesserella sp.]|uniref:hypothetical protein n=1 Tax=Glaesserella sp. TaxID=2094731 RepID=UPI0035A04649
MLISSVPSWVVFSVSLTLIIAFILFVTFGSYTRRENIVGEITMQSTLDSADRIIKLERTV